MSSTFVYYFSVFSAHTFICSSKHTSDRGEILFSHFIDKETETEANHLPEATQVGLRRTVPHSVNKFSTYLLFGVPKDDPLPYVL